MIVCAYIALSILIIYSLIMMLGSDNGFVTLLGIISLILAIIGIVGIALK